MSTPFSRAPHMEGATAPYLPPHAPNAALLVDFDNVTMGMRSDLSKELKTLLNSDIIKGKVTVQRAYADWRRYPQYIVPLSEASIDLIFAPAYGSSKKNATDIRMAIDGMELVFTRPEIGTYILLTGDSDFSSLVLKLKEYGKYVIGVGIQESSSDILVQNCDEYYSYTSLSGLRKTSDGSPLVAQDPWVLVEKAVEQMERRNDVMRSDRLKQVMLEIDPGFEEKSFGFTKFSRFLTEAAQKGLVQIRKMENGQYEVNRAGASPSRSSSRSEKSDRGRGGRHDGRKSESRSRDRDERKAAPEPPSTVRPSEPSPPAPAPEAQPAADGTEGQKQAAYDLLRRAISDLLEDHDGKTVRDSDVKRRMLAIESGFDEAELGFSKFSLFLKQAVDDGVVTLDKGDNGQFQVGLTAEAPKSREKKAESAPRKEPAAERAGKAEEPAKAAEDEPSGEEAAAPTQEQAKAGAPETGARGRDARETAAEEARRLRPRQSRRRGVKEGPPPLLEGQVVTTPATPPAQETAKSSGEAPSKEEAKAAPVEGKADAGKGKGRSQRGRARKADAPKGKKSDAPKAEKADSPKGKKADSGAAKDKATPKAKDKAATKTKGKAAPKGKKAVSDQPAALDPARLHLPTDPDSIIKYLSNSYAGVGQKTAESLVDELGGDLFRVLQTDPGRVRKILTASRASKVLEAWQDDFARRKARLEAEGGGNTGGR